MHLDETLDKILKYAKTIQHDSLIYWSGEKTLSTDERKSMLMNDINLMKNMINSLEEMLAGVNNE